MPITNVINTNAAKLRELHEAVKSAFKTRHQGAAQRDAWMEAARRFHKSFDRLAFPGGLDYGMRRFAENDPAAIESAVQFLEADPIFFRSGYIKEEILERLRWIPLDPTQKRRLQQLILARIMERRVKREFGRYCRLAPFVTDPSFEEKITVLAKSSGVELKHAQWVLKHLKQGLQKESDPG